MLKPAAENPPFASLSARPGFAWSATREAPAGRIPLVERELRLLSEVILVNILFTLAYWHGACKCVRDGAVPAPF
jgi:hypothetical protein